MIDEREPLADFVERAGRFWFPIVFAVATGGAIWLAIVSGGCTAPQPEARMGTSIEAVKRPVTTQ